jgi:hypothetical protein
MNLRSICRWSFLALVLGSLWLLMASMASAAAAPPLPLHRGQATCPRQTTPLPVPITLTVTLQRPNSPPPSPAWAVPITFTLYPPGDSVTICHEWNLTLDQNGRWSEYPLDLFTGTYDARVRSLHTLRNVKRNLTIAGPATIDMGTLYEGDANADNVVNILDFARLRNSYFLDEGMPGFDPTADFDENNTINILDFGLLRGSYFMEGDIPVTTQLMAASLPTTAPVTITLVPLVRDLAIGEVVGFSIQVNATPHPLLGLDVELFYQPSVAAVTDAAGNAALSIIPGNAFSVILQNRVDIAGGRILFSAANFDQPVAGIVEIARFYFKGQEPGPVNVRFGPHTLGMDAAYIQVPLVPDRPVITVGGVGNFRLYHPLMSR